MKESYVEGFAQAYDTFWHPYPARAATALLRLHEAVRPPGPRRLLDIGCGTGIVAERFLGAGFRVTGLDRSAAMLARARVRLGDGVELRQGDATDFELDDAFPFAISTYDIPNHLRDAGQIAAYLRCAFRAVSPGGLFAFDLATRKGLRGMNQLTVRDTEEAMLIFRGALNEDEGVGFYRISGVVRAEDGRYDRFETTMRNIVVDLDRTLKDMAEIGWSDVYVAAPDDLLTPLAEVPDSLPRVYVVARKPAR
ncbi:class I SAM-dependent DNA methyltransferase [Thermoactinospora rubra]|uniref:class I SAM-dependent DNA methyltransferase n=1 Tax=Thermoactinospora rubra TaxID=1088767 RepID=UPI000A0F8698|nr:class I SAM-dependent methyltransferase [Thermoactinospora rubra]